MDDLLPDMSNYSVQLADLEVRGKRGRTWMSRPIGRGSDAAAASIPGWTWMSHPIPSAKAAWACWAQVLPIVSSNGRERRPSVFGCEFHSLDTIELPGHLPGDGVAADLHVGVVRAGQADPVAIGSESSNRTSTSRRLAGHFSRTRDGWRRVAFTANCIETGTTNTTSRPFSGSPLGL